VGAVFDVNVMIYGVYRLITSSRYRGNPDSGVRSIIRALSWGTERTYILCANCQAIKTYYESGTQFLPGMEGYHERRGKD
jgi:hypothetical protein